MFSKKDADDESKEKPSLKRTLSKNFGKKKEEDGTDVAEKPPLTRTLSKKFGKKKDEDKDDESTDSPKPSLRRTLSKKFGKKKEDGTDVDDASSEGSAADEKPSLKRTLSRKFGKVDAESGAETSSSEKPSLTRTLSQRFKKTESSDALGAKKKLKVQFDVSVRRVTKCPINNTTVFLGWKLSSTTAGDTRRAVVTDCSAVFNDIVTFETVLSGRAGGDASQFKEVLVFFELKEDKLIRKAGGRAKWNVLGRGSFNLADYASAQRSLVIIPLIKKKISVQLEMEVTASWIHFDGKKFEKLTPSAGEAALASSSSADGSSRQRKIETIGSAKYAVSSDTEGDCYTEEDIDLNLSELETDDDDENDSYQSVFAKSSNPFAPSESSSSMSSSSQMSTLLGSLSGVAPASKAPIEELTDSDSDSDEKLAVRDEEEKKPVAAIVDSNPFASKPVETKAAVDSNPFGAKEPEKPAVVVAPKTVPVDSNPFGAKEPEKPAVVVAPKTAPVSNNPFASAPAVKKEEPVANPDLICHDCKTVNKAGWKFCDKCGARSKAPAPKPVEPQKPVATKAVEPPKPVVTAKPVETPKVTPAEPQKPVSSSSSKNEVEDLRATIDRQKREIDSLKETERKFANSLSIAEKKVLAAESQLQAKERELKRMALQAGDGNKSGDSALLEECKELNDQVLELEAELLREKRRREMYGIVEKHVYLGQLTYNRDRESVCALKLFDDLIRLRLFDESLPGNHALMDQLFHAVMMMCQNAKAPYEITQYWETSSLHLLRFLRDGKKRLEGPIGSDHPLNVFETSLCQLVVNLYTRLFTYTLRKIEQLLVESLGSPYARENYFRVDQLAMGTIIKEFQLLFEGFQKNFWPAALMELFFDLCISFINRFLLNKILENAQFCTFNNGVRIKMEISFLTAWLVEEPQAAVTRDLVAQLDHIVETSQLLIMSKGRNTVLSGQFHTLNPRQMHTVLSQYQATGNADASSSSSSSKFPVIPQGLSNSSREIVEKLEKQKGASLAQADSGDIVDPLLMRRLEEDHPDLKNMQLLLPDNLSDNLSALESFLKEK